jgi:predicted transcriptional regulator of viral defense system
MEIQRLFHQRKKMTRLGEAVAGKINKQPKPLLSNYELFFSLWSVYQDGGAQYLRGDNPSREIFRRTRHLLRKEGLIRQDADYSSHWRVTSKPDAPAEDIICSVDPYCYISHISAMQRYGLTNRRPENLYLTEPTPVMRRQFAKKQMNQDYGENLILLGEEIETANAVRHPEQVRGRPIEIETTKFSGDQIAVKGGFARVSTIGQTFLDTLDDPDRCGGIAHVLEIWLEHARTYLDEIIDRIERTEKPIIKVRAGYILDEHIGLSDSRIKSWEALAQRGSSRVLNPSKPFASVFSEKWMLSLNV